MNEIEKLIAGLPRPSPSPDLEVRISAITRRPVRSRAPRDRMRWFGVLAACTACAGVVGFLLGRQSVEPSDASPAVAVVPEASEPAAIPTKATAVATTYFSPSEALARFVMPPKRSESLFGNGPLEVRTDSLPLE